MTSELKATAYVSRSRIGAPDAAQVDILAAHAKRCNARHDITGVLLFSGRHFAQYLEGAPARVDEVMDHIVKDPRHTDVVIFLDAPIAARNFEGWALAYSGASTFVDSKLQQLWATDRRSFEFEGRRSLVMQLFHGFTSAPPGAGR